MSFPRFSLTWTPRSMAVFMAGLVLLCQCSLLVLAEVWALPRLGSALLCLMAVEVLGATAAGAYWAGLQAGYRKSRDLPPTTRKSETDAALKSLAQMADRHAAAMQRGEGAPLETDDPDLRNSPVNF